jgi:hypothetical protein
MSTFMKKKDDETWTEWNNRWFNDQDKLDCIEEYIYEYTVWGGKGREITDLLLCIGIEGLIPLLESEELLDAKIEEAYKAIREFEEYKMSEEEEMFEEDCLSAQEAYTVVREAENTPICHYKEDEIWTVKPVKTLTVAEMIEALSKLPPDAKLVMTENMNCDDSEFGEVILPEPYIVGTRETGYKPDIPDGTKVYRIGHSNNRQY